MVSKYIVNAVFEHEINAINAELNVCLDYLCNITNGEIQDAKAVADKLAFAAEILHRMQSEINKL